MNDSGLCSIKMNGVHVELLFGMPACEYFFKRISDGSVLVGEEGIEGTSSVAFLIYSGYYNHCIVNGVAPKMTIADFINWIQEKSDDESVAEELRLIGECYRDSKEVVKFIKNVDKRTEEIKKKISTLTGTKSDHSVSQSLV